MRYGKLGRANVSVSKICLGTMHFGPKADRKESFEIMDMALDNGINFFDTADIYGGAGGWGLSESIVGDWLAQGNGRREKVFLATKVYWYDRDAPEWPNREQGVSAYKVARHAEDSLRRLKTDRIDLYQVHHIDRRVSEHEYWESFERLQDAGKVIYNGTSNFPGWGLATFQKSAIARGRTGIVSEQTMYNLFCRWPELEVIPAARRFGIGILAYMPLAGGLLTGNRSPEPGSRTVAVAGEYEIALQGNEMLDRYSALCKHIGEEERNVAIAWVLNNPVVATAIVGIRKTAHLEGVLRAAEIELDDETVGELGSIFGIMSGRPLRPETESPEAYAW